MDNNKEIMNMLKKIDENINNLQDDVNLIKEQICFNTIKNKASNKSLQDNNRKTLDTLDTIQTKINDARDIIKESMSEVSYNTWIAPNATKLYVDDSNNLIVKTSNSFNVDILEKRYKALLLNACKAANLCVNNVEIIVDKEN